MATLSNDSQRKVVQGSASGDYISNTGAYATIYGNGGNDTISNYDISHWSVLDGGAGNDKISSEQGNNLTIIGGLGNDTISFKSLYSNNHVIQYNSGDGNDYIEDTWGNPTATLEIGGGTGTYSSLLSGNDIIVTVEEGKITIAGGKNYSGFIISGVEKDYRDITLTEGNDTYTNSIPDATIQALGGNDTVNNFSSQVSIDMGAGNDSVFNHGSNCTINTSNGHDTVYNYWSNYTSINTGAGNDSVFNHGSNVTINTGGGDDSIYNYVGADATINTGAGDDFIRLYREYNASSRYNLIQYSSGDGDDYITGFDEDDTLQIGGSGNYFTVQSGDDIIVNVGEGSITLEGAASLSALNIAGVYNNPYLITGSTAANSISNTLSGATIQALGGADTIVNKYPVSNVSINAGAGDDMIVNEGTYSTVDGEAGNDRIWNDGSRVTITGGTGDDSILNRGDDNIFRYNSGDGNDTIAGFKTNSTLEIGGGSGTYSVSLSGNDIILTVGSGKITLEGAATLSTVNISGIENTSPTWTLDGTTATYGTWKETLITISGVKSTSGLSVSGTTVTVSNSALNNSNVTISDGYNLKLGSDVSSPTPTAAGWTLSGTTATYKTAYTSAGYNLVNNQIVYSSATGGNTLVTVSGVKSTGGLNLDGSTVTVSNSALNNSNVTISDGYTLKLGSDVSAPTPTAAGWNISGTTATYKTAYTSAGYNLVNNQIVYSSAAGGNTLVTVSGVKSLRGLSLDGSTVTVSASALNNSNVSISDGYNLKLASDVSSSKTTAAGWTLNGTTATYNTASNTAGYTLNNNQIIYTAAKSATNLVTVSGVKSTSGLSLDGSTVTVSASALNNSNVSISDGYNLKLANDVSSPKTTAAGWSLNGSTATYNTASNTAGYTLNNNSIIYTAAKSATNLVTVSGVKSTGGLSVSGTTVTVSNSALNNSNVTISDGYTLKLGNDVSSPKTTAGSWSYKSGVATYTNDSTSAGYELVNNQIVYSEAVGGETLTQVSGVKSSSGLELDGTTVKVSAAALNAGNVTITNGYTLELGDGVNPPIPKAAGWTMLTGGIAIYRTASNTSGYTLNNNEIVYTPASGGNTLITVNGVKSADGLKLAGNVVKVSASALNQSTVTVSDGYTLDFDGYVEKSSTTAEGWKLEGTTAKYYTASNTAGYNLANNMITYTAANPAGTLVTVTGVKSVDGLKLEGNVVKIAASALNQSTVTVSEGYTLELDSGVEKSSTTAEGWKLEGSTAKYYTASNTAGYILANNTITYTSAKSATTLVTVTGVKSVDGLKLEGNVVKVSASALNQSTVTVTGGYTLALADDVEKSSTTDEGWHPNGTTATYKTSSRTAGYSLVNNQIVYSSATPSKTLATVKGVKNISELSPTTNNVITLNNAALDKKVTVNGSDYTFDFAEDYNSATITGSTGADKIIARGKNLSISGGKGNDLIKVTGSTSTINGGVGDDTIQLAEGSYQLIAYNTGGGSDLIQGFDKTSTLRLDGGKGKFSTQPSGSDVLVIVDGGNEITLKGAANLDALNIDGKSNDPINIDRKANNQKINGTDYGDTIKSSGERVTILSGAGDDSIVSGSKYSSINAGAGNDYVKLTAGSQTVTAGNGNDSVYGSSGADKIFGGAGKDSLVGNAGDDTLSGGAGDDKIFGGAGNDSLVGGDGKDTLSGGAGNDKIIGNAGNDNLTGGAGADIFVYKNGDGNDTITDYAAEDKIQITKGTVTASVKNNDVILTVGSGKITVKNSKDKIVTYITPDGKEHAYSNVVKTNGSTITLQKIYSKDSFDVADYGNYNTINAAAVTHELKITGNKNANKITGGKGDDYIDGLGGADIIFGEEGNDTILGGKGNDKLTGGSGADVFIYSKGDGNDVITDYDEEDTIQITGATVKASTKGANVILTVGGNNISLEGAAALKKRVTYIDNGETKNYLEKKIVNGSTVMLTTEYIAGTYTAGTNIVMIDAADVTRGLKITGNGKANEILGTAQADTILGNAGNDYLSGGAGNDSLVGGEGKDTIYGGTGDDTLIGGAGNDELWGNEGSDTFIYGKGAGKDTIFGFEDDDILKITGTFSASYKDDAIVFNVGNTANAITLKDFTATTFNINGAAYKISDTKLVRR